MRLQILMGRNSRGLSLVELLVATALTGGMLYVMLSLQIYMARESSHAAVALDAERRLNEIWKTFSSTHVSEMFLPQYIDLSGPSPRPNGPVNSQLLQTSISATWFWESGNKYMYRLQPQLYALRQNNSICVPLQQLRVDFNREAQTLALLYQRSKLGNGDGCNGIQQPQDDYSIGPTIWRGVTDAQLVNLPNSSLLILWVKSNGDWRSISAGFRE